MAKFKFAQTVEDYGYFSAKIKGAITANDVGKPMKLSVDTTDTYELCSDGDSIDGFLVSVESATADGLAFSTVMNYGMRRVEMVGTATVGDFVESAAVAAAGTAETNNLGKVAAHTPVVTDAIRWRIVSANTTNGAVADGDTTVIVERV